jgi:hypothetical protein
MISFVISITLIWKKVIMSVALGTISARIHLSLKVSYHWYARSFIIVCINSSLIKKNRMHNISQVKHKRTRTIDIILISAFNKLLSVSVWSNTGQTRFRDSILDFEITRSYLCNDRMQRYEHFDSKMFDRYE